MINTNSVQAVSETFNCGFQKMICRGHRVNVPVVRLYLTVCDEGSIEMWKAGKMEIGPVLLK